MIGYVTLGTNDLPRAAAFYDALLAEIGAKRLMEFETGIAWGVLSLPPSTQTISGLTIEAEIPALRPTAVPSSESLVLDVAAELRAGNIEFRLGGLALLAEAVAHHASRPVLVPASGEPVTFVKF